MLKLFIELMERGYLPDFLIRIGVRALCRDRLRSLHNIVGKNSQQALRDYALELSASDLAESTKEANEQHYELPTDFFLTVLGNARKYSCTYWDQKTQNLDEAEQAALEITVQRAQIENGMSILELGCGWGSLSLFMANKFPQSRVLAVSNSASQKEFILAEAKTRGLKNLEVLTINLGSTDSDNLIPTHGFDRVVSVEMFEHFKNYQLLLARVANWLRPTGKLFVHIFTHNKYSYPFETAGADNWMGRYFFSGGQMPAEGLLAEFQDHLALENQWKWSGTHYQKTSEAWLQNLDENREKVLKILVSAYGTEEASRWLERWRVFFISCAELFGYRSGSEWGVTHYLFAQKGTIQ
jgi:cyclopropane-fatty-acyl-phospholipid synthase